MQSALDYFTLLGNINTVHVSYTSICISLIQSNQRRHNLKSSTKKKKMSTLPKANFFLFINILKITSILII